MNTQYQDACNGIITDAMRIAAGKENVDPEFVREKVAAGCAVICSNPRHKALDPVVVGNDFSTKINANIGRSPNSSSNKQEIEKMQHSINAGADFLMDLSVGLNLSETRLALLEHCSVPFGTVPIYEALSRVDGDSDKLSKELLVAVILTQAEEGVDFMTLHAGVLKEFVPLAVKRKMGICSRGGAIMADWMMSKNAQNPLYTAWDEILEICAKYDVTVSLGDGLRPGCLADASDEAQFAELDVLGELVQRCRKAGVQVMVEGPGHVPFDQIKMNMEKEQEICDGAPFYVLGPVVIDVAPGYDHITAAIGATAAATYGASLLCYVTPAEHLGLPDEKDVVEGVIAFKIAAHAADVAKGIPGARDIDDQMAEARIAFDWKKQFELAITGDKAEEIYKSKLPECEREVEQHHCSMCGKDFCAVRKTLEVKDRLDNN
ncbi:MAG: phosphomethylpyrimidine synthase ThiC [Kiritimatiellae bacterium]|jgi:phosphomethylpyrimidine synthase|nr:phosphomethylpyrimidine synthase ThiC [Kiritimatiellia bacterium]